MGIIGAIVRIIFRQVRGRTKPRLNEPQYQQDGGEKKKDGYRKRHCMNHPLSKHKPAIISAMSTAQTWDPASYARNARFVSDLGSPVVDLLAPKPGERILDLGCGDGVLTKKLADMGCEVVAVDSSVPQIEKQRGNCRRLRRKAARFCQTASRNPQKPLNDWFPDARAPRLPGSHEVR
jgi:2-polyprenyl-3-methyl-5-hydroxy-6-metoxy-1,4-benzoquinol methylase